MTAPRRAALRLLAAMALAGACATAPQPTPRATLVLACNVPDASVWVDDNYGGPASTWAKGNPIPAGFRRVEVRHPSYFSFFAEINPKPGETVRLAPTLRPALD